MNEDEKAATVGRLVREHLDRLVTPPDAQAFVDRVRADRPSATSAELSNIESRPIRGDRGRLSIAAWIVPALVAIAGAFLIGRWIAPSTADASTIVGAARIVQRQPVDRSYRASFHPDPEYWDGTNVLRGPSETVLWTRGDRFWADTRWGKVRLVYGRDEAGTIWLSPSRSSGVRFSGDDAPDEIDLYCAINAMTVSRLLDDVLVDFDLEASPHPRSEASAQEGARTAVMATLKPGRSHPFLSSALLEVDEENTLVRLILWTLDDGQPRGTVTYTLTESADLDDGIYRLAHHVDADAKITEQAFSKEKADPAAPPAEEK